VAVGICENDSVVVGTKVDVTIFSANDGVTSMALPQAEAVMARKINTGKHRFTFIGSTQFLPPDLGNDGNAYMEQAPYFV
jgi:hypothetical protein